MSMVAATDLKSGYLARLGGSFRTIRTNVPSKSGMTMEILTYDGIKATIAKNVMIEVQIPEGFEPLCMSEREATFQEGFYNVMCEAKDGHEGYHYCESLYTIHVWSDLGAVQK